MCNYFLFTCQSIILGILALCNKYCKSQKQARALCYEAYKEVRKKLNKRQKQDWFGAKGCALHFGYFEYDMSFKVFKKRYKVDNLTMSLTQRSLDWR